MLDNIKMKFPLIVIKDNEAPIYYFDSKTFGLVSKGGETFYKSGTIYDSDGSKYLINGVSSIGKAGFWKSIVYLQPMSITKVNFTHLATLSLSEIKSIIISHVSGFKKYWKKKDIIDGLNASILGTNSYSDLYSFIK